MGYQIRIFERGSVPGEDWHYTDQVPLNALVPNLDPSVADCRPHLPPENMSLRLPYEEESVDGLDSEVIDVRRKDRRAPKPIWYSLKSTVPQVCLTEILYEWIRC
ncbi:hypothetical protein BT96DRAFT_435359 [Gymnopus androsaceus JB14]|uniref:Uncharacterized protein n=1 Tax=Gymnopus androsaceus JB14 TaxID=1447944 RepID=A0A6A4GT41_9AGAR|nr:hypothetical protein BT96DRAFT_435359 [Gymnopus androsaceus JB14]